MKQHLWVLVSGGILALGLAPAACGSKSSTSGAGGASSATHSSSEATVGPGTGGSSTAGKSACDAPATSPSKGACYTIPTPPPPACVHTTDAGLPDGGAAACDGLIAMPNACDTCAEEKCCAELSACNLIPNCLACLVGDPSVNAAICGAQDITDATDAISACKSGCCAAACSEKLCNPVTNEGCSAAGGEACDIAGDGSFVCQPPVNNTPRCGDCSSAFCVAGTTCNPKDLTCARYCCADTDCGSGACDLAVLHDPKVGICVTR
jgi:hypothetical protein